MKFISKLYFNVFKNMGNLRFMFVISCLFALMSAFIIIPASQYYIKIINLNNFSLQETLNAYSSTTGLFNIYSDLYKYVEIKAKNGDNEDKQILTDRIVIQKYCLSGHLSEAYNFAQQQFINVGKDKEVSSPELLCKKSLKTKFSTAYSLEYLLNYLWIIFWFYFPFLMFVPIRFIINGYTQDRNNK